MNIRCVKDCQEQCCWSGEEIRSADICANQPSVAVTRWPMNIPDGDDDDDGVYNWCTDEVSRLNNSSSSEDSCRNSLCEDKSFTGRWRTTRALSCVLIVCVILKEILPCLNSMVALVDDFRQDDEEYLERLSRSPLLWLVFLIHPKNFELVHNYVGRERPRNNEKSYILTQLLSEEVWSTVVNVLLLTTTNSIPGESSGSFWPILSVAASAMVFLYLMWRLRQLNARE